MRIGRWATSLVVALSLALLCGCAQHIHKIGSGPSGTDIVEQRQWYILWGLVPLNNADSSVMAAGATNYEIKTATTPLDFILNIFTGIVTVNSRTVTVTK